MVALYDILNMDGDLLGTYTQEGELWPWPMHNYPEIWDHIKDWKYFTAMLGVIIGTYKFRRKKFEVNGKQTDGLEIVYDIGPTVHSIATVVLQGKKEPTDNCPKCKVPGKFVRTAMVCPRCGKFLGGF